MIFNRKLPTDVEVQLGVFIQSKAIYAPYFLILGSSNP